MKNIIIISDNHGERECLDYIRSKHIDADYFFHLGDSVLPAYLLNGFASVKGNNDHYNEYPERLILEIEGHRFLLIHGHKELYFNGLHSLYLCAKENGCDVVCYGHTHIYDDCIYRNIRFLNPGSIIRNRDCSVGSYMDVLINEDCIKVKRLSYQKVLK